MTSDPVELRRLVKQLQSTTNEADVLKILDMLKKDVKANESLLRESKAGLAVGKLRHHESKAVADVAKDLVKKWKAEVDAAKAKGTPKSTSSTATKPAPSATPSKAPATPAPKESRRTAVSDGVKLEQTGDKARDKCIQLMYDALVADSPHPSDLVLQRALVIEKSCHSTLNNTEYRQKIRQLFTYFSDKKNPSLKERVVSGELPADKLATMSSADMASDQQKDERAKIEAENLFLTLGAGEQQAETDAFQCGKCKQRKCRYRQAQTRSADEPMTTFVTCVNCNNRWKFS